MSEVKWIKLSVSMFDDEKIRIIENMPEADTIIVCWVKLLSLAGKTNANGYIFITENIAYTDEMLAAVFNRPLNTVRMALETFRKFGMIDVGEDNLISINNWSKHQNLDRLEEIKEQNRARKQKQREKQKQLALLSHDGHVTVTEKVTDIDKELDLDKELDKDINNKKNSPADYPQDPILQSSDSSICSSTDNHTKKDDIPYTEIVNYLNQRTGKGFKPSAKKTKELVRARWNDGFRLADFQQVVDNKAAEWLHNPNMNPYLRPETLFGTRFESYLNQKPISPMPPRPKGGMNRGDSKQSDESDFEYIGL